MDEEGLVRAPAHLQGIAIGSKDVQDLLSIPGDVLERRPGVQRGRRSKILALSGRTIMSLMRHSIRRVSRLPRSNLKAELNAYP